MFWKVYKLYRNNNKKKYKLKMQFFRLQNNMPVVCVCVCVCENAFIDGSYFVTWFKVFVNALFGVLPEFKSTVNEAQ